ncbi:hypothetical protein E3N88_10824 [Mikania micrantha]|uniref:Coatomer subunit zeta n=1 Tax=Mikania micrantha TaxID=192012 RepID=A0A5N6PBZ9_9ASTR|nr:hypothetical protein E3N88_10824 [Mikania micrantha]
MGNTSAGFTNNRERGVRSLSRTEWEERRKKGLCYQCGQLYGPGHRCPEGKLRVLLLGDDEDERATGDLMALETSPPDTPDDSVAGTCLALEMAGLSVHKGVLSTFKLEGAIQGIPICLLVDSGATHNFISTQLVSALDIPSETFAGIHIRLGDGHVVFIQKQCVNLQVQIGSCTYSINTLVFETGDLDLILGMDWLQSLGSFNGVPSEERLHWRSFLVKLGADNLKGVKNEELLIACHKSVYIVYTVLGHVSIYLVGKDEYDELALSEAIFVITSAIKDVCGKPPTERLFLDKYGRICLCLDEIVWKGLLENTDKDRIKRLIRLKPPTEF